MTFNFATDARCRQILTLIPKGGASVAQMAAKLGVERASAEQRLRIYMKQGLVFVARAKVDGSPVAEAWYFTDAEDCEEFRQRWITVQVERDRARSRAKYYARRERMGKTVKVKPVKATPRPAEVQVVQKGTRTPPPAPLGGPARAAGEPIIPADVKYTRAPNTWQQAPEAPPCFSALRPGQYLAPAPAWVEAVTA